MLFAPWLKIMWVVICCTRLNFDGTPFPCWAPCQLHPWSTSLPICWYCSEISICHKYLDCLYKNTVYGGRWIGVKINGSQLPSHHHIEALRGISQWSTYGLLCVGQIYLIMRDDPFFLGSYWPMVLPEFLDNKQDANKKTGSELNRYIEPRMKEKKRDREEEHRQELNCGFAQTSSDSTTVGRWHVPSPCSPPVQIYKKI